MNMAVCKEKKVGNINVHLTDRQEVRVRRLAELQNKSASAYLRDLVVSHLQQEQEKAIVMREIFEDDGSVSSPSS